MKNLHTSIIFIIILMLSGTLIAQDNEADNEASILEFINNQAEADEPEFTILSRLIEQNDAIYNYLSDPSVEWTIFAPTDEAFEQLLSGENLDDNSLFLTLLQHLSGRKIMTEQMLDALEANNRAILYTPLGQPIYITGNLSDGLSINDANLIPGMFDIETSNGVIHTIDAVLQAETRFIGEVITSMAESEENPELTILAELINEVEGLPEFLSAPPVFMTFYAPSDMAFEAFKEEIGEEEYNDLISNGNLVGWLLAYHMGEGLDYSEILSAVAEMENGLEIAMLDESAALITYVDGDIFIDDAQLIVTDILAQSGVIHIIDRVLIPGN